MVARISLDQGSLPYFMMLVFAMATLSTSCAGPTTPFGPIDGGWKVEKQADQAISKRSAAEELAAADDLVKFRPARQNLHQTHDFHVTLHRDIRSSKKIQIRLIYKGRYLDELFETSVLKSYSDDGKAMTFTFPGVRLDAFEDHDVQIELQEVKGEKRVVTSRYRWQPPTCSIEDSDPVYHTGPFNPPADYLDYIRKYSKEDGYNPALITGLIAQESSFDSQAISWAKAIGLTQVTQLAEKEISEIHQGWPQHKLIKKLPVPVIKALVAAEKINDGNEWRLNPEYSIRGGLTYIKRVQQYWRLPDSQVKLSLLPNLDDKEMTKIILASYNSGPARVKYAILTLRKKWLNKDTLSEAKKYVNRILSYCYHFGNVHEGGQS